MRTRILLVSVVAMLGVVGLQATAADDAKLAAEAKEAIEVFKKADSTIAPLLASATGYAVFPTVGKGGLGLGGARGSGEVYEGGKLIGHATLTQVTIGLQIGGQSFSELILFENQAAMDRFKESKTEMSAQIGAVAAAEGAAKNAKYVEGVMIFTRPKSGLMAEASLGGQKFQFKPLPKD